MDEATIAITVMSGLFGAIFLGFLIWGLVKGQFRNVQEASRHMIRNNVQYQSDLSKPDNKSLDSKPDQGGNRK